MKIIDVSDFKHSSLVVIMQKVPMKFSLMKVRTAFGNVISASCLILSLSTNADKTLRRSLTSHIRVVTRNLIASLEIQVSFSLSLVMPILKLLKIDYHTYSRTRGVCLDRCVNTGSRVGAPADR